MVVFVLGSGVCGGIWAGLRDWACCLRRVGCWSGCVGGCGEEGVEEGLGLGCGELWWGGGCG